MQGATDDSQPDALNIPLRTGIALYRQIADILRHRIENGFWKDQQLLPTMEKLATEFNVSLITVRQAIRLLVNDGLLTSRQGKGTFVTFAVNEKRHIHLKVDWNNLLFSFKGDSVQHLESCTTTVCPLDFGYTGRPAPQYRFLRRVHSRLSEPFATNALFLDERVFVKAPETFTNSLVLLYLREYLDHPIELARQILTVHPADEDTAGLLGISSGTSVVNIRRIIIDTTGLVVYTGEVNYRADRVNFDIELSL